MSVVPEKDKYRGLIDALKRIPQREGYLVRVQGFWQLYTHACLFKDIVFALYSSASMQALYRGNGANVLRLVPEVGLKFALNDQFRTMFTPSDGRPIGFEGRLAAGAATGIVKVTSPLCPCYLSIAHQHGECCLAAGSTEVPQRCILHMRHKVRDTEIVCV